MTIGIMDIYNRNIKLSLKAIKSSIRHPKRIGGSQGVMSSFFIAGIGIQVEYHMDDGDQSFSIYWTLVFVLPKPRIR